LTLPRTGIAICREKANVRCGGGATSGAKEEKQYLARSDRGSRISHRRKHLADRENLTADGKKAERPERVGGGRRKGEKSMQYGYAKKRGKTPLRRKKKKKKSDQSRPETTNPRKGVTGQKERFTWENYAGGEGGKRKDAKKKKTYERREHRVSIERRRNKGVRRGRGGGK